MPVIPAFGRWRQEDQGFKVILSYIVVLWAAWATRGLSPKKGEEERGECWREGKKEGWGGGKYKYLDRGIKRKKVEKHKVKMKSQLQLQMMATLEFRRERKHLAVSLASAKVRRSLLKHTIHSPWLDLGRKGEDTSLPSFSWTRG